MNVPGSSSGSLLVFVVDDDPVVASALAGILRTSGCQVKTFLGGSDLIDYSSDRAPDVVVTDCVIQPMDGLSVAAWVRNSYPTARIVTNAGDAMVVRNAARQNLPFPVMEELLNSIALIAAVHGIDLNETAAPEFSAA
jgi:CheY-like chemotaxis protein